jgi:cytochrome c2
VTTHRKDQLFGPHIGEVVARGIKRAASGDYRTGSAMADVGTSYSSWNLIASYIAHEAFVRDMSLTRETLSRKGSVLGRLRARKRR